ncbi:hypothetical protein [Saccharopolyspora sp. 5N708]
MTDVDRPAGRAGRTAVPGSFVPGIALVIAVLFGQLGGKGGLTEGSVKS